MEQVEQLIDILERVASSIDDGDYEAAMFELETNDVTRKLSNLKSRVKKEANW